MANIKQLLISGIRSFGPDENDKQLIVFKRPLTLILGENGCGKTTIIESLKYALCGELPPNCNKGQSFVHDPKVNKSREVLGQIRLQFVSPNDTRYLIVRSMQAQIKQKTMQFKSIDSTIQIIDDPTNPIEISGRCGQTDATIASILGVSKAILNNVIFCHQEDSNWPLEEGKKLKERFDAIFDATKYNKCFESIRKMTKQYKMDIIQLGITGTPEESSTSQLKICRMIPKKGITGTPEESLTSQLKTRRMIPKKELSVKYALERRQDYDAKKVKIVGEEEKIRDAVATQEELVQRLVPLRKRLSEIDEIEKNIMTFVSKKELAKARLENIIRQQRELKQTIKTFYIGTDEDLKTEIDTFASNLRDKENQIEDSIRKLNSLKNQDAETAKKISSLEIKKSELFTLEGQHQEKISSRNNQILRAAEFAELEISGDIEDEDEAGRVMDRIEKKRRALAKELKDFREKCEADVKDLQKNVDSCRDASARHKQKIICRKQETQDLAKKVDKLKSEINIANQSKSKLDKIQADLALAERNLESISGECDVSALQDSINTDDAIITQFEKDLEELNQMITKMQAQHAKQTAINLQKEELGKKEKTATRYKNKNRDVMVEVLGRLPDKKYKETFQNCQQQLKNEVDQLNKNLKLKQHEITSLESKRNHQKEELKKKKNEITTAEEQLYNYCGKLALEDKLSKVDADINGLQDQKMGVSSFEFVTRKFVEKLKEESPCCPLCHRGFESQQEIADLISELGDKVRDVPKNLDSVINSLSRHAATRDQLVSMRPLDKKVKSLKNEEIPALEKALDKTEKDLQEAHDEVDELQMSLSEPERKLEAVASMLPDMSLLDQTVIEIATLTAEVSKLESQIDTSEFTMNQDEAVAKQKETRQETNRLRAVIKSSQTKLNKHNQKLQQARDKKNQLTGESLKIQAKIQELCSLQAQLDSCEKEKERGELDLRTLMESSNVLQIQLDGAENKRKALVDQNRIQDDKQQKQVVEFDKMCNVITGYNREISAHKAKDISGQLDKLKKPLLDLQEKKEQLFGDLQSQASTIDSLKDDISNHQVNKRDLDDNLSLRSHQQEQRLKEQEIRAVDEKIGQMNYVSLSTEKDKLFQTQDEISQKKAETVGIIKKLQEFVKEAKAELKQPKFKDVHEEYKKKLYEMILLKSADRDLRDYSVAMDLCLMQFHKEKMTKINNIIRDMWRNIYRGNDIDYIEIKTDENADSAGSGTKRVYNYRVVQKRNDTEIDMRGRCSAGQKVLACLIIRMALAETFSNRFGVLALDEPTTNLDKENVTSLCNALGDMVLSRMNQNNFMFIIITHDAEFLTALGRIDKLTHYYKVTRNQDGRSRIARLPMA